MTKKGLGGVDSGFWRAKGSEMKEKLADAEKIQVGYEKKQTNMSSPRKINK